MRCSSSCLASLPGAARRSSARRPKLAAESGFHSACRAWRSSPGFPHRRSSRRSWRARCKRGSPNSLRERCRGRARRPHGGIASTSGSIYVMYLAVSRSARSRWRATPAADQVVFGASACAIGRTRAAFALSPLGRLGDSRKRPQVIDQAHRRCPIGRHRSGIRRDRHCSRTL